MSDTGATGGRGEAGRGRGGRGGRGRSGGRGRGRGRGGRAGGPPRPRREDAKGVSANPEDSSFPSFVTASQLVENTRGKNLIAKVIKVLSTGDKRTELLVGDATGTALVVHVGSALSDSLAAEDQWLVVQNAEVSYDRRSRKTQVVVGQFGGVKSVDDESVKKLIPEGFGSGPACSFTEVSALVPDMTGINVLAQVVGPVEGDPKPARPDGSIPPQDFKIADPTGQFTVIVRSSDLAEKLVKGQNTVLYNCRVTMQTQEDKQYAKMRLQVGPWSNIVSAAEIKADNLPASFNPAEFKANTETDRSENLFKKK